MVGGKTKFHLSTSTLLFSRYFCGNSNNEAPVAPRTRWSPNVISLNAALKVMEDWMKALHLAHTQGLSPGLKCRGGIWGGIWGKTRINHPPK